VVFDPLHAAANSETASATTGSGPDEYRYIRERNGEVAGS